MGSPPELLQFFLSEAADYLDALDQLVANPSSPPDATGFVATTRALRGSATMARATRIADVAFAMEQLANALREGELQWSAAIGTTLHEVVTELRMLIRDVHAWSESDDHRAAQCIVALQLYLPKAARPAATPPVGSTTPMFIALQASAIASDLDAFAREPDSRRTLDDVLTRVRIMRGIAGIGDYAPLPEVCDAIERAARALVPDAPLSADEGRFFRAAALVLRRSSDEMRSHGRPDANADEVQGFASALTDLERAQPEPERVVPIDSLFHTDAGPHVVHRGDRPPLSREQRFREELVPRAEHLTRLVADARVATDIVARERTRREIVSTLRAVESTAQSFGAAQLGAFVGDTARQRASFDNATLDAISATAALLLAPQTPVDDLERRLAVLARARYQTPVSSPRTPPGSPVTPPSAPAASGNPTESRATSPGGAPSAANAPPAPASHSRGWQRPAPTPTGRELQSLLQSGLAGLQPLEEETLSQPGRFEDDEIVSMDSLLYRGPAALARAIELRDALRANGSTDAEALRELYDLLDLARSE